MANTDSSGPVSASASGDARAPAGLARGRIQFLGGLAQSVGLLGPSAGAGILVGAVFGTVGPLGWLTWLIGIVAISCVGYAIYFLSRRYLTTGGLYPLAAKAGGQVTGYFTAYGALFWLIIAAPAVVLTTGIFSNALLSLPAFGLHPSNGIVLAFSVFFLLLTAWIAYAGIRISVRILLGIELLTGSGIVVLLLITLFKHPGGVVDHSQFHLGGTHLSTILSGIVLVTFAFGGFESATILGQESRHARRNIPLAVISSILVSGLFLAFTQYVTVLGFSGHTNALITSPDALGTLAGVDGIGWYAYIVTVGLILATAANNIALYNAGARMLFTLPREGVNWRWLVRTSKHRTPSSGILVFAAVNLVVMIAIAIWGLNPVTAYGNLGTLSGYGTIVMYVVTCIAAVILMIRTTRNVAAMAICLVGAAVMSYGMYTFLHPFPHYPASVYAWIFIGASALAVIGYLVLRLRRSTVFEGRSVEEDTAMDPEDVPQAETVA
jgi:amino acid transporter